MADQTSAAVAQLSMRDRRAYREFRRPYLPPLINATHQPFFSLENAALWITAWGLELFLLWDDSEVDVAAFDAEAIRGDDLISFRDTILPPEYAVHEFFSLDNAIVWVLPTAYAAYVAFSNSRQRGRPALIRQRGRNASSQATSPAPSRTRTSSASSRAASVLSRHSEFALPSRSISRASHHSRFPPSVGTGSSLPPTRAASISSFSRQSSRRSLSNDSAKSPRSSSIDPAFIIQRQSRSRSGSPDRKNEPAFPLRVLLPEVPKTVDSPVRRKKSPSTGRRRGTQASQPNAGQRFQMTRELSIERVIDIDSVPPTWSIPRDDAVYRLKLAEPPNVPQGTNRKRQKAKEWTIDGYIKHEDQDSWGGGSAGHKDGDVWVTGFADDLDVEVWARRSSYHCNGVNVCELVPDEIFADCERYDIDVNAMRELWQHELDSKEREASSYGSLLLRFYARVMNTKCKRKDCPGHAIMILLSHGPNQLGKIYFIGCSEWHPSQRFEHIYIPIPANINETMFKFMFDNNGQLPAGLSVTDSDTCYITAHPRVHMSVCPAGHSVIGFAIVPKIIPRPCLAEIIMFIPAPFKGVAPPAWLDNICLVYLRNFHNHPAHPHSKPSVEEEARLEAVINAIGVEGLTNSPLTVLDPLTIAEYNGERLGKASPAFADARRVQDFIKAQTQSKYPFGMGWAGVIHYRTEIHPKLDPSERYIHTAIVKDNFRIVVTMHPILAQYIHRVQALCIDYTFKRIDGSMDEWEIVGMLERFNKRVSFGSLYCDSNTTDAFFHLFSEFFDVVKRLTGTELALRGFRPEGTCRAIVMDGEAAQALGLGQFLVQYNDPALSNIHSRDPKELVLHIFKGSPTSNTYFRHIDKMPESVPRSVKARLRSFPGLATRQEIDGWHEFVRDRPETVIQNWYKHKLNNPWFLPSLNKVLSFLHPDDFDTTPNDSNLVETAHAGRNAETSIGLPLLSGILTARDQANRTADEFTQLEDGGPDAIMANRWNTIGRREKRAGQRLVSKMRKHATREAMIEDFQTLTKERQEGNDEWTASLTREKAAKARKSQLKAELKGQELKDAQAALTAQIKQETTARRRWLARRGEIDEALDVLRKGELRGARIPARRDLDAGLEVGSGLEVSTALQVGTLDMAAIDDFDFQMSPRTASAIARAMDEYEREHGAVLTSELATLAAPASMVAMPPAASEPNGGYTGIPRMDASGLESLSSPDGRTEVSGDTVGLLDTRIVAAPTEAESLTEAAHPAGPSTSDTTPEEPRKRRRAATTTTIEFDANDCRNITRERNNFRTELINQKLAVGVGKRDALFGWLNEALMRLHSETLRGRKTHKSADYEALSYYCAYASVFRHCLGSDLWPEEHFEITHPRWRHNFVVNSGYHAALKGDIQLWFECQINTNYTESVACWRQRDSDRFCDSSTAFLHDYILSLPMVLIIEFNHEAGKSWKIPPELFPLEAKKFKAPMVGVRYDIIGLAFSDGDHFICRYRTPNGLIFDYDGMKLSGHAVHRPKAKTISGWLTGDSQSLKETPEGYYLVGLVYVLVGAEQAQRTFENERRRQAPHGITFNTAESPHPRFPWAANHPTWSLVDEDLREQWTTTAHRRDTAEYQVGSANDSPKKLPARRQPKVWRKRAQPESTQDLIEPSDSDDMAPDKSVRATSKPLSELSDLTPSNSSHDESVTKLLLDTLDTPPAAEGLDPNVSTETGPETPCPLNCYGCGTMTDGDSEPAVQCEDCGFWTHEACLSQYLGFDAYTDWGDPDVSFKCRKCAPRPEKL
ncbi:hypothetical protein MIND_01111600 [Mycena indigotica]|uniref:PHD-type domain-containing protein n=1 Tax=Mycena indigotica TaxID=2126181 RepID=A0A8H6VVS5_9AGAR|nr:uncharacterized protein MIND_01111600 [Mycena indigotica]KAF7295712.1 hypothetical protein MIND_01111600 [Mycena indigotica]